MHRRQHRSIRYWRECGDSPESSGRGMQEEIRCRTREAPKVPGNVFLDGQCTRKDETEYIRNKETKALVGDMPGSWHAAIC